MESNQQTSMTMPVAVIEAIKSGNKIKAIKLLRQEKGLSLKDAKEAVEVYVDNNADIKDAFNANQSSGFSQQSVIQMALLVIVLFVIYMVV